MVERIKKLRKILGLNQTEFGKRIGVNRDTVANIENDRIEIKDIYIQSICREFGINQDWIVNGIEPMYNSRDNEIAEFLADVLKDEGSFKKRFVSMLSKLPDNYWEVLEDMINRMIDDK